MRHLALLFLLQGACSAFQFPFAFPFFKQRAKIEEVDTPSNETLRIAIIGAGAAGSSAAFWISKAQERFGIDVEVDIYDKVDYIGGRSTTIYPYGDPSLSPLELGASIFVNANKNLWRATDEFNLTRETFQDEQHDMGIWDGEKLLLSIGNGWKDTLKVIWRYGIYSPKKTDSIVSDMIKKFLTLYSPQTPRWDNITNLATQFEWTDLITQTTSEYFQGHGVSKKYVDELIEASTRVNYAQNADAIHALEGACSMAATGAASVKGGNRQIFERFVQRSGANVFLNTTVKRIAHKSSSSHDWAVTSDKGSTNYKGVIIAAPFHQTGIKVPNSVFSQILPQPYIHLHVTQLVTNSSTLNPAYFGLPPSSNVPGMMLTTWEGVRQGGKPPEFNSVSYHGQVREGEWAVKIFSMERVCDEWLEKILPGSVKWVYRKEWFSYPKLPPTTTFPPVKLDNGLYYVNAFEPFISTMETETIAARNVVDLLLNEEFGSGICGARIASSDDSTQAPDSSSDNYVFGWDC